MNSSEVNSPKPWWKFGFVWLIIAGPVIVVVAGFVTLYLAISSPNEIVSDRRFETSNQARGIAENDKNASSMAPAVLGRNHAATGVVPVGK